MSKQMTARGWLVFIFALLVLAMPDRARAASIKSSAFEIGPNLTDDDNKDADDISGISCLPPDGGKYVCLVIDDEGRLAQAATIEGSKLRGGGKIRLIGKEAPADIVGKAPTVNACSDGPGKFKDLDGEAVARDDQNFYVAGSHGCSRNGNKFRASSFVLARVPDRVVAKAAAADTASVDESGPIATSYRLAEALLIAPQAKEFFTQDLMTKNGLNIEGLAILDGKMYAGLRGPVGDKKAFLVGVDLDALFDAGKALALDKNVSEIELDFLQGRGIRDLAVSGDGRLVVLSGPARGEMNSFALHFVNPKDKSSKLVAILTDVPDGAKAEGLHVLGQTPKKLDLVIMFDGPKNGGARRYDVELD